MVQFAAIGTSHEKGKALERIFGRVLKQLGYHKLNYNIQRTGEEIDIQGKQIVTSHPIKCQCKALNEKVASLPLRLFRGDLEKAREKDKNTIGIFVSASGFKSTAQEWFNEQNDDVQKYFFMLDEIKLFEVLKEANLLSHWDQIVRVIQTKTSLPVKDKSILISEKGLFWEIILRDEELEEEYYLILDGKGEKIKKSDNEYLMDRISSQNNYISLEAKEKLFSFLIKYDELDTENLFSEITEPEADIKAKLASLRSEGIINQTNQIISLRQEIESLLHVARYFKSQDIIEFMKSSYFKNNIKTLIIPHIKAKFRLELSSEDSVQIKKLILLSPTAVINCLFGDSTPYRTHEEHLESLNLDFEKKHKYMNDMKNSFIEELAKDLFSDIKNSKDLSKYHKMRLIMLKTDVIISTELELFLKVKSKQTISFMEAGEEIRAGQLVGVTGPGPLIKNANAFSSAGEFDRALKEFYEILETLDDENTKSVVIHNIGLVYFRKRKYNKAIQEFEKVKDYNQVQPEVFMNLCRCYQKLRLKGALKNTIELISQRWPDKVENLKRELIINENY